MIEEAILHHNRGEFDQAAKLYREILADDPKHVDAMHLLGLVVLRQGDLDEAERLLKDAMELAPESDSVHASLGELLLARERFDAAEGHFEKAVGSNPNNADALSGLGLCRLRADRIDDAVDAFERALLANPDHPVANTQRGMIHLHLGQTDLAEEKIRQALKTAPDYAQARLGLAEVLMNQQAAGLALVAVEKVLEEEPDNARAQRLGAELLLLNNRLDECERLLAELHRRDGDDAELLRLLGDLALARQQPLQALSHYQRGIQLTRHQAPLAERLGDTYALLGQWPQTERIWRQFSDQQPHDPRWKIRLAETLARQDQDKQASDLLPDPSRLSGDDRTNALRLSAELALRQDDLDDAARQLESIGETREPRVGCMRAGVKLRQQANAEAEQLARQALKDCNPATEGMLQLIARRLLVLSLDRQERYEEVGKMLFFPGDGVAHRHAGALREQAERIRAMPAIESRSAPGEMLFLVGFGGSGLETFAKALSHASNTRVLADRLGREPRNDLLNRQNPGEAPERDGEASIDQANRRYMRGVRRLAGDVAQIIDVLPASRANPEILARHFPGARVIVLDRDPADVVLQNTLWGYVGRSSTSQLLGLTEALQEVHKAADGKLDLQYHWLDFDAITGDPEALAVQLAELGLAVDDAAINAFRSGLHDEFGLPAYLPGGHASHYRDAMTAAPK